jgi:hypothetical protein
VVLAVDLVQGLVLVLVKVVQRTHLQAAAEAVVNSYGKATD